MGFLHYTQGDSALDDPVGYELNHKSEPYTNSSINSIQGMSQQSFDYYQNNIRPVQQNLTNFATDPNQITKSVNQAESDVSTAYSRLPQAFAAQASGLGIVPTAAQTAAFTKASALSKGEATAAAANTARATTAAQQAAVLGS